MKTVLAFALAVLSMPFARAGVRVVREGERFQLVRDGQPFFIKGGGGKTRSGFGVTIILARRWMRRKKRGLP